METIHLALVDDHRLFRSGIASLVSKLPQYNILFEAGDGEEMIRKITPKTIPDIILLDISMPKMDGIAAAEWIKKYHPEINIIILSMFKDAEKVIALVKMGIKGYLLKDAEPYEFEEALYMVSKNEVYYPNFVTRHLINSVSQNSISPLSERELEFLKLVATELTYKEIADHMCISARTVDGYRDQLFDKLKVKSRVGLVIYCLKNKLIEL